MYSTWFSVAPRGYCERTLRGGWASNVFGRREAERDECCEDGPSEGVFDLELGSEVRSVSTRGGWGDLDGRDECDICDGERDEGKDESDVRRPEKDGNAPLDWELLVDVRDMKGSAVAMMATLYRAVAQTVVSPLLSGSRRRRSIRAMGCADSIRHAQASERGGRRTVDLVRRAALQR